MTLLLLSLSHDAVAMHRWEQVVQRAGSAIAVLICKNVRMTAG
jgi:hypothetical protein